MTTMAVALDRNLFLAYYSSLALSNKCLIVIITSVNRPNVLKVFSEGAYHDPYKLVLSNKYLIIIINTVIKVFNEGLSKRLS